MNEGRGDFSRPSKGRLKPPLPLFLYFTPTLARQGGGCIGCLLLMHGNDLVKWIQFSK